MVFSKNATGSISVKLATKSETDSGPLGGTYVNTGVMTVPGGTINVSAALVFAGTPLQFQEIAINGISSPEGYRISCHTDPATGIGSGYISSEVGESIGTFEFGATGGNFYPVTGEVETYTY